MKYIDVGNRGLKASAIALGCMRISALSVPQATALVETALALGINLFDHADIYGAGKSEELFSQVLASRPDLRSQMILQSKCGIRSGWYDLSKAHILASADGILRRLHTDYLDILLLHRPDTLMEPEEIADAFEELEKSGKVRYFGVSNMNPMQIELLQRHLHQKIIVNQLQFSAAHTGMIDTGIFVNTEARQGVMRDGSVLEYCRLNDITIQSWSSLQYGVFEGTFLNNEKYPALNGVLARIAEEKNVTPAAVAIAWILRHPANMQAVVGSTNPARLEAMAKAADITLSRHDWYEIYQSAGNPLP